MDCPARLVNRTAARRVPAILTALVVVALLMCAPAVAVAADQAADDGELASAGPLLRGSGYESGNGARAVRELQRRLRRLGDEPGPIDGLYGPLTEGAVERFQHEHGLAIDGVVGPQTKRWLLAQGAKHPSAASASQPSAAGASARPPVVAGSAVGRSHAPAAAGGHPDPGEEEPSPAPTGVYGGLLAALAIGLLLVALWIDHRDKAGGRLNLAKVCAALFGVFVISAALGRVVATQSGSDAGEREAARSGAVQPARILLGDQIATGWPAVPKLAVKRHSARARSGGRAATARDRETAAVPEPSDPRGARRPGARPPSAPERASRVAPHAPRASLPLYALRPDESLGRAASDQLTPGRLEGGGPEQAEPVSSSDLGALVAEAEAEPRLSALVDQLPPPPVVDMPSEGVYVRVK